MQSEVSALACVRGPLEVSQDLMTVLKVAESVRTASGGSFNVCPKSTIRLIKPHHKVELSPPAMLDLGGIAKGFACDEAVTAIRGCGVDSVLVEAGGDLRAAAAPPAAEGWRVITASGRSVVLYESSVSTSGDGAQPDHLKNLKTGFAVRNRHVTVIGPSGLWTDPIATAVCVSGDPGWARELGYEIEIVEA